MDFVLGEAGANQPVAGTCWDPVGSTMVSAGCLILGLGQGIFQNAIRICFDPQHTRLGDIKKNCTYSKYCACGLYGFHF